MPHLTTRRTLTIAPQQAMGMIHAGLPTIKDAVITADGNPIHIDRKRRLTANRYAMNGTVGVSGNELIISLDGAGSMHKKFADEILALLPETALYDHGIREALAKTDRSAKFFGKASLSNLIDDMQPGEHVMMLTSGNLDKLVGIIVLTNQRILVKSTSLTVTETKEIAPKVISSISTGKKMTGETIKLTVSGTNIEISALPHGRGVELASMIRQAQNADTQTATATPAPAPAPASEGLDHLTKLAELHAAGVLTDEEFSAAKAKALGL